MACSSRSITLLIARTRSRTGPPFFSIPRLSSRKKFSVARTEFSMSRKILSSNGSCESASPLMSALAEHLCPFNAVLSTQSVFSQNKEARQPSW